MIQKLKTPSRAWVAARIPIEMLDTIDDLAEAGRWTRSHMLKILLEEALAARKRTNGNSK